MDIGEFLLFISRAVHYCCIIYLITIFLTLRQVYVSLFDHVGKSW